MSVSVAGASTANRTPDDQDFIRHLETDHRIPASVLDAQSRSTLADFHEIEHTNPPLWTRGPHQA
jgi:hypothetical protein